MKFHVPAILLILASLAGCASLQKSVENVRQRTAQEEKLLQAVKLLGKGDTERASPLLESIVTAPGVTGVTDEALFRLALLSLPNDAERGDPTRSLKLLERLQKEYPSASWSSQASAVTDFLASAHQRLQATSELRRQLKSLKDQNLSLTRENKELRLNFEKLKSLDVELERKSKP
ncbi:MAG: tetratricopeptide repeat protein [Desulfuromonadales bacterium]|nr:MAG: tetratricopeptide repeat protein [Desulfuromonadales bacterium]